jgi:hypothetical protein
MTYVQTVNECTGIGKTEQLNHLINIYPNPNNGSFNVSVESGIDFSILNETGQLIRIIRLHEGSRQLLQIDELPKGIYFISGQKDGVLMKGKIVVAE